MYFLVVLYVITYLIFSIHSAISLQKVQILWSVFLIVKINIDFSSDGASLWIHDVKDSVLLDDVHTRRLLTENESERESNIFWYLSLLNVNIKLDSL